MGNEQRPIVTSMSQFSFSPQESPAKIGHAPDKLYIGMPAHDSTWERRMPLTPNGTAVLINNGHRVVMETEVAKGAFFTDHDYAEAGAEIMYDRKQVYEADIILKTAPPSKEELELMHPGQILLSPIQLSTLEQDCIEKMVQKRITALAFEYVKDDAGFFPFVRSMSEIAGYNAILIAAELMSHVHHGKGVLLGGLSGVAPAKVVILGAGVVGEFAARAALGLGANVKVFDDNIYKLMRLQNNVGKRLFTSILDPEILVEELIDADVAIGAVHSEYGRSPIIVTEEIVSKMKAGAVIIDVSIDQGGCFETSRVTTHEHPTFTVHDVIHYGVPNIPSRVSRTASQAISNILSPLLLRGYDMGGIDALLHQSAGARHGLYSYKGRLCNAHIGEKFNMKYTDVNLLFTSGL